MNQDPIAGRLVVASISGGKDSAALSLALTERGIAHERVFQDTGWEHPITYHYGGRQFEMFAPASGDTGCVRWGLCEGLKPEAAA